MIALLERLNGSLKARQIFDRYAPWAVIALAAFLRLWNLGYPAKLVFDETYYVKDAWTLWNTGSEKNWPADYNANFEGGNVWGYLTDPAFVVHPPLGKWIIGLGMWAFGADNSFSWRMSTALLGIASVALLIVVAQMLFKSPAYALIAGFLLAIDGHAIVLSRTALLDNILAFFALLAFYFLLRDQQNRDISRVVWARPWLIAAGATLGAASAVKWSGLYFLAAFGLYVVISETLARRRAGQENWAFAGFVDSGLVAFVLMVPVAIVTYIATWSGWLIGGTGYDAKWAESNRATGIWEWVPTRLQSLWHYHQEAYGFHVNLHTPHSYQSNPLTWLLATRPTSFFYEGLSEGQDGCASASGCSSAITALGNPFIWLPATAALLFLLIWFVRQRDRVAGLILLGIAGGYLPWLAFTSRTVFQFYSIAFLPWMILALAYVLKIYRDLSANKRQAKAITLGYLVLVFGATLFFLPIWIGTWVPFWYWQVHMWLPSWI